MPYSLRLVEDRLAGSPSDTWPPATPGTDRVPARMDPATVGACGNRRAFLDVPRILDIARDESE
jgi:hypothetical protein